MKAWGNFFSWILLGLFLSLAVHAADAPGFPRTLTDGAGRMVKLATAPQRIVSVSPAATDILVADQAKAQLVGVTRYCNITTEDEKHIARIGGVLDPDYERILSLKPDLVVVPQIADKTLQEKMISLGLPVLVLHPEGLQGVLDDIRMIGRATGHDPAGETIAQGIDDIKALVASRLKDLPLEKRSRVLVQMGEVSPAPGAYVDDILTSAGGRNVLPRGLKAWVAVSPESALQLAPEVVIEIQEPGSNAPTKSPPLGKARLVVLADSDAFYRPGPAVGRGIWELARAIYPDRFLEVSPPPTPAHVP